MPRRLSTDGLKHTQRQLNGQSSDRVRVGAESNRLNDQVATAHPLRLLLNTRSGRESSQAAIDQAQALRDKDKDLAQKHLAIAKTELDRAKLLGYAGNDPEYESMNKSISDLEKQLKGKDNTTSAFAKLREKVASFFNRHFESEKRSSMAQG